MRWVCGQWVDGVQGEEERSSSCLTGGGGGGERTWVEQKERGID